jgi:hypothetical protein
MPRKGFRKLIVDGASFHWRFDGALVVVPEGRSSPTLVVEWGPSELLESASAECEPTTADHGFVVTPGFVSKAIRSAFTLGWTPDTNRQSLKLLVGDDGHSVTVK